MYRLKKMIPVICLVAMGHAMYAQNDFCSTKNTSFADKERLTMRVYYNMSFIWINAGTAEINTSVEELNGHKTYHVVGTGRTAKSYEWFFKVRDKYETYLDKETMLPSRFVRTVNEGGFKINQDVAFNHKKGTATSEKKTITIPKCTHDVLSAVCFARNINYDNYEVGDKIPFTMYIDDENFELYIKYLGKEEINTRMGKFKAIKIRPLLVSGTVFQSGEKMIVWVSDDSNHVPLRVESQIAVGSIKADLVDYANLRNPFTSMISAK